MGHVAGDEQKSYYDNTPFESLNFEYNIRGWLKGINKNYANANTNSSWFGMELSYDWGFDNNQFNGNIAGAKWRSKGDGEQRAFGYGYDAANRLLYADFTQNNGGWNQTAGINFSVKMGDGLNHYSAYDANGNIKQMQQWGVKLNNSVQIDNLTYDYFNSSNKLKSVYDAANDADTKLGDFRTSSNSINSGALNASSKIDYSYDTNGNLTEDKNKDISSIIYNHLNLPYLITVNGKGTIQYIYDAAGNKLEKRTQENSPQNKNTKTTYINGYVYQNDSLQFLSHEEGRIRYKQPSNEFVYDYFIKDHLGNTRMVLTEEQQVDAYPVASLETNTINSEKLYYNIPDDASTRINKNTIAGYPTDSYTNPNDFIQKLNGNGTKVGTSITLKVMAGDSYNLRANSWYRLNGASPSGPVDPFGTILSSLISGVSLASKGKATVAAMSGSGVLNPAVLSFTQSQTVAQGKPKAYLNWILLDEQLKYVGGGFDQVGSDDELKTHARTGLPVTKNGYLYIYVSNETPNVDVFFDNVQVTHVRGPLLEETHYYPFGLTMAGISSKAAGKLQNKIKFNSGNELQSGEFSDASGLELYDAVHRRYDQQLGRFNQIDALADISLYQSPYNFGSNNPIRINDPLGLTDNMPVGKTKSGETIYGNDDPNAVISNVTVVGHRKRNPTPFYFSTMTKSQTLVANRNEATFWDRYLNHKPLSQPGDLDSYTSKLSMYQKWSREDEAYRKAQLWLAAVIISTPAITAYPALFSISLDMAGTKAAVSILAQGIIKGVRNIDLLGVGADAIAAPGLNGIMSGSLNYTPFSRTQHLKFGWEKTGSEFFTDFSAGLSGGIIGDATWKPLQSLLKNGTEKSVLFISTQSGLSVATQAVPSVLNQQ